MASCNPNSSIYPYPFPCCTWDPVCNKYSNIKAYTKHIKRYERKFKRIVQLSKPKHRFCKYQPSIVMRHTRMIEIIRPYKHISTRLEQLALVQLRKLLELKKTYGHLFDKVHKNTLNRAIRRSIFSLYGRLAGVVPPKTKVKPYKWTPADWKYMRKRLRKLAAPKKEIQPAKIVNKRKPLAEFTRTKKLAVPKWKAEAEAQVWVFNKIKGYKAPQRIVELATPITRPDIHFVPLGKISKAALTYTVSERVTTLATPRAHRNKESDVKENAFEISPNALKGKASARVVELSEPREFPKEPNPDDCWKISPTALTYKATPRIIELAQPKGKR